MEEGSVSETQATVDQPHPVDPSLKDSEDEVSSKTIRGKMAPRSDCWKHFKKFKDPVTKREKGECLHCGKTYFCGGTSGTTILNKHFRNCPRNPDNDELSLQHSLLSCEGESYENEGIMTTWIFDQEACRDVVARWIISEELPFRIVESKRFKKMMRTLCPRFKVPSRWTISRDCGKVYSDKKLKLKEYFKTSTQRISITTDTWTSIQKINYMCITAHFIDVDWKLQKKVINFCEIDSHKGNDIGMLIEKCLLDWDLKNLFTITVDNASSNDVAVAYVKEQVMNWGFAVNSGKFIHMRCMAHVINFIVQDGLKEVGDSVKRVRAAVRYVRYSPSRLKTFLDCAEKANIQSKNLSCYDCPTRWNSTYLMLSTAEKFEKAFERLKLEDKSYKLDLNGEGGDGVGVPTLDDWENVRKISVMLKMFYNLTMRISGTEYVTSNSFWTEVSSVLGALMYWINGEDVQLKSMAFRMKSKFDKYWGDPKKMNKLIWFAAVFDPCEKFEVVNFSLTEIYGYAEGTLIFNEVKDQFNMLFKEYQKMHDVDKGASKNLIELEKETEDLIEADCLSTKFNPYDPPRHYFHEILKKRRGDNGRPKRTKLDMYLDEALVDRHKGFDILNWWKLNSARFPILSIMARDILAVPVSTVASESTFSTGGRVLDAYRSSLSPKVVESLICAQDWIGEDDHPLFEEENIEDVEKIEKEFTTLNINTAGSSSSID